MNIPAPDAPAEQAYAIAPPTRMDDQILPYQLDELWFNLYKDIIRDALDITPTNDNDPFVAPPSHDTVIEYVNTLGYPSTLRNVLAMSTNTLYQPWRAILSMINMCLTDFVQSIQTFLTDRKNLATASCGKKKTTHMLIPSLGMLERMAGKSSAAERGATESSKATNVTKPKSAKATKPASVLNQHPLNHPKLFQKRNKNWFRKLLMNPHQQKDQRRRTPMPTKTSRPAESPSLDVELALTDSHAGSNLSDAVGSQPQPSHVVHAGPNLKPMDLEAIDASPLQKHEHLDEEFTTTTYLNVQENLKLPYEDLMIPEEHVSSTGTLSPLPTLSATTSTVMTTTIIPPPPPQPQQSTAHLTLMKCIDELEQHMANLLQYNLALEERLDKHGSRLYKLENLNIPHQEIIQQRMFKSKTYEAHEDHKKLYDALEKSLERDYSDQLLSDLEKARYKKRKRRDVPRTPSGSPLPQPPPPPPPAGASGAPEERPVTPEPTWTIPSSNVSAVKNNWATTLASIYVTPAENSMLAKTGDMTNFLNWYCRQVNKTKLTQEDLEGQAYKVFKAFYPDQFFFNKDLEYLSHVSKGSSPALSISKMKAASYLDFSLKLLMLEQMWIEDVCTYGISAKYGISHWWFNRHKFYTDRHESSLHKKEVRSHMQILSVIRNKAYSRYMYDYLREIVLRRADLQEHAIAKKDFKNLHPSDFEDLNLLFLHGHLYHLPSSDKKMLSTAVKLWTRNLVIRQRVEDFQLALAYIVKEFKIKRLNPGMNTRFWTQKDVRRSKEFIAAIKRRLKTRRIYQNLECFVGGRVHDIDYRLLQRTE
nr:hypothetical protein [Tanacetum cinerariifolium]